LDLNELDTKRAGMPGIPEVTRMKLRIVAVPYRYDERDDGLGLGPRALLDHGLAGALRETIGEEPEVVTAELPDAERVVGPVAVNIGRLGANVGALVSQGHERGQRTLVLAGDDTAAVGVVSGLQQCCGAAHRIGVVWIDAHGDFNTPETSVSNILAGMPVAILAGLAGPLWREAAMLAATIPTDRIVIAGVRELDEAEERLLRSTDVTLLRQQDAVGGGAFAEAVERLADKVDDLYVHVDLDVLDPSLVPSASTPSPKGMSLRQLDTLLSAIFATGKVAVLGVAGLNPGAGQRGRRSLQSTHSLLVSAVPHWQAAEA
jgi:arginase